MKLLIALAVGIVLYLIVSIIYKRFWHKGLNIAVDFEQDVVRVDDSNTMIEKIANNKVLPISILQIRFAITKTFKFAEAKKNAAVSDQTYRSDFFSVLPYQKVTRSYPFKCTKRGCYKISSIDVFGMDFFISKARRMTLKSPKLVYVLPKKLGEIAIPDRVIEALTEVKQTQGKKCVILLNTELNSMSKAEELIEDAIKIADAIVCHCFKDKVPVALYTNAVDMVTGEDCRTEIISAVDDEASLEKTLARIDTTKNPKAFKHVLGDMNKFDKDNTQFIVISNNRKSDFVKVYEEFAGEGGHSSMLIIPEFKNVDIAPFEDDKEKVVKWVVEND